MKIDRMDVTEECWIALVEDAATKGHQIISVPVTGISQKAALLLAMKLDISVSVMGSDYLFTTTNEATRALLLADETLH